MSLFRPTKAQSIVSPFLAMRPATVNWFESLAAPLPLLFHCSSFSLRIFILSASDILGSTSTLDFWWNIQTLSALCLFVCVFECKSVKAYTLINCVHKSRHTWKLGAVTMREKKCCIRKTETLMRVKEGEWNTHTGKYYSVSELGKCNTGNKNQDLFYYSAHRFFCDLLLLPFLHLNSTIKRESAVVYWPPYSPGTVLR